MREGTKVFDLGFTQAKRLKPGKEMINKAEWKRRESNGGRKHCGYRACGRLWGGRATVAHDSHIHSACPSLKKNKELGKRKEKDRDWAGVF